MSSLGSLLILILDPLTVTILRLRYYSNYILAQAYWYAIDVKPVTLGL